MSRKLRIRKRRLARCRNRLERLKKQSEERKKKLNDRCNKLSAKFIKIITKIIDKIEARRRQRLPQRELEQIVQRALSARYPDTYYRLRNDTQPYRLGTSLLYNLSVMDVGSSRESLFRCVYDLCMDNVFSSRSVALAVVTQPAQSYADPRCDWRAADASVLRVMNPDLLTGTDSSSDSESESWGSRSASVGSTHTLLTDSSSSSESESESDGSEWSTINSDEAIDEQPAISISSLDCVSSEWSDEEFEYSDEDSRYGSSALSMSASSESEQSDASSMTRVDAVSGPFSDYVVPHLPDLYFIDRPDPALCCLVTSALRELDPSILGDGGFWSCSNTSHADPLADCGMTREIITKDKLHSSTDDTVHRARRNRKAFLYRKASGTEHLRPLPLTICKRNNATIHSKQDGPLSPPLGAHCENQLTPESMSACVAASSSASASPLPHTLPMRQNSLCFSCRDIRERRRALTNHPFHPIQNTHHSDQHPVPEERTGAFNPNNLPSPLRAGPRCTHCTNTWSGMISTPDLLSSQLSTREELEDSLEDTPSSSRASTDVSFDLVDLVDVAFNSGEGLAYSEIPPDLIMCLNSGAIARNRRIFDNDGYI